MKKLLLFAILMAFGLTTIQAQKYFTREGKVSFTSEAPLERIEANNHKATSVMDAETGKMEFAILIKAFQFEKALMQEHFNENYLESSKFPKAVFKGEIVNLSDVNFSENGTYKVNVKGQMTIHGVTKEIEAPGTITINNGDISAASNFQLTVADYEIEIPSIVREKIAKTVDVAVDLNYQPYKS